MHQRRPARGAGKVGKHMGNVSWRFELDQHVRDRMKRDDPLWFTESHTSERVSGIQTPDAVGGHATSDQLDLLVNHALAFNKRILDIVDLGDNIPPIAITEGSRPVSNARCEAHKAAKEYPGHEDNYGDSFPRQSKCPDCRVAQQGDDTSVGYSLNGYGFKTLSGAIVFAIALRDRGDGNDARSTAQAINRILGHGGDDWR